MPDRRRFLAGAGALLVAPLRLEAQPGGRKIPKVAYTANRRGPMAFDHAFVRGLGEHGYDEGRNLRTEYRWGDGTEAPLAGRMRELVDLRPDVIVASGSSSVRAAMNATASIPIVMTSSPDAVRDGLVASLARPGANVTGMSLFVPELAGKRLELLTELLPGLTRVATIWNTANPGNAPLVDDMRAAAQRMRIEFRAAGIRQVGELEATFAGLSRERIDALCVLSDGFMAHNRGLLLALAARHRLPTVYPSDIYVEDGGLVSYGPSIAAAYHRAANFVDRILKGVRPVDLPVELPTKFELVINLKTAAAIGLRIPASLLLRAEGVVE